MADLTYDDMLTASDRFMAALAEFTDAREALFALEGPFHEQKAREHEIYWAAKVEAKVEAKLDE